MALHAETSPHQMKFQKDEIEFFFIMLWLSIEHSIIGFYNPTQTILYLVLLCRALFINIMVPDM
jgi:hypothetical protein